MISQRASACLAAVLNVFSLWNSRPSGSTRNRFQQIANDLKVDDMKKNVTQLLHVAFSCIWGGMAVLRTRPWATGSIMRAIGGCTGFCVGRCQLIPVREASGNILSPLPQTAIGVSIGY